MSEARIEQFKKMAEADPDNELGHFSLGRAYLDAGKYTEAAASLERAIALNANLSKAYQLLGEAMLKMDMRDQAIARFSQGVKIADARGDVLPRNEMTQKLKELGVAAPEVSSAATKTEVGEGQVLCKRCGRVAPKMVSQPFSNAQGKMIYENICAECWKAWIGMGTKVINELRLPLSDPQAQKIFDQHMMEFLNLK